jgi:hypothetical protein
VEHLGSLAGNCREWDAPPNHATVAYSGRDNITHHLQQGLHLRLEWLHYGGGDAYLDVLWRPGSPSSNRVGDSLFSPIPASALSPSIPAAEQWRQDLQAKLSHGWNTWMRDSAARHLHLPSGFGFEVAVFDSARNESFTKGLVDKCHGADANSCKIIPGHHSFNGSATSYVHRTEWDQSGVPTTNVTISSGHVDNGGDNMVLVVEPSRRNTTLWAIFTPGFFFDCAIQEKGGTAILTVSRTLSLSRNFSLTLARPEAQAEPTPNPRPDTGPVDTCMWQHLCQRPEPRQGHRAGQPFWPGAGGPYHSLPVWWVPHIRSRLPHAS